MKIQSVVVASLLAIACGGQAPSTDAPQQTKSELTAYETLAEVGALADGLGIYNELYRRPTRLYVEPPGAPQVLAAAKAYFNASTVFTYGTWGDYYVEEIAWSPDGELRLECDTVECWFYSY